MKTQFVITEEMLATCSLFANNSIDSSSDKYSKRNQFNVEKIKNDIRNGKIAEEGVWQLLSELYPNLSKPDHTIYDKFQKSWDPDLKDKDLRIAVKSQDIRSEIDFGRSWVFQIGDGNKDCDKNIFKNSDPNHYVCFVSLNVPKKIGDIRGIVKVDWLHENKLFKPMQISYLSNKVAVYYDDIENLNIWQLK